MVANVCFGKLVAGVDEHHNKLGVLCALERPTQIDSSQLWKGGATVMQIMDTIEDSCIVTRIRRPYLYLYWIWGHNNKKSRMSVW